MTKEEKQMTKEEAIHILEYERDNDIFCSSYRHKVHIAMTMGVEAIKQTMNKSDTISRQDAVEAVRAESAKRLLLGRGDVLDILYALPSTDNPKGEWEKATESIWKCSLCNAIMFTTSNYCPNCGAVMRGRSEE